jgi:hypothetical protein
MACNRLETLDRFTRLGPISGVPKKPALQLPLFDFLRIGAVQFDAMFPVKRNFLQLDYSAASDRAYADLIGLRPIGSFKVSFNSGGKPTKISFCKWSKLHTLLIDYILHSPQSR